MKKRIISFMTALSMTLMLFTSLPINVVEAAISATKTVDSTDYLYDPNSGSNDNYYRKDEYNAASARTIDSSSINCDVGYGEVKVTWSLDSQDIELIDNICIELVDTASGRVLAEEMLEKNVNEKIFSGIGTSTGVRVRLAPATFIDRYKYIPENPDDPSSKESAVLLEENGFAVTGTYVIRDIGRLDNCTHELVFHDGVRATCTIDGHDSYSECSKCHNLFSDENGTNKIYRVPIISALGHNYESGFCTRCGLPDSNFIVSPKTAAISLGRTGDDTKTFSLMNYGGSIEWLSEPAGIINISPNGIECTVTGIKPGTCKLIAKANGEKLAEADITVEAHGDLLVHSDRVEPTCTEDGRKEYWTCSACAKYFSDSYGAKEITSQELKIPPLGHNYVDGKCTRCQADGPKITLDQHVTAVLDTSSTSITCTATVENLDNPVITFACEPADIVSITQEGAFAVIQGVKAGEGTVTVTATDGTNTVSAELGVIVECAHKTGITYIKDADDPSSGHWKNCGVCGKVGKELENHNMDIDRSTARPATCTEDGKYYDMVCAECDYRESGAVIAAKGHSFTSYVSNNDATCTADGTKTATCDRCDETETIADAGSALGHDYVDGECTKCGDTDPNYVPPHTHTFISHAAVSATCTTDGNESYWTCTGCDKIFSDGNGTAVISAIPTIPALGHNYVDGICTRCGDADLNYVPPHTHTLSLTRLFPQPVQRTEMKPTGLARTAVRYSRTETARRKFPQYRQFPHWDITMLMAFAQGVEMFSLKPTITQAARRPVQQKQYALSADRSMANCCPTLKTAAL